MEDKFCALAQTNFDAWQAEIVGGGIQQSGTSALTAKKGGRKGRQNSIKMVWPRRAWGARPFVQAGGKI